MPDYNFVGALIGILGFLIAAASFFLTTKKISENRASQDSKLETKLDFIGDDVKDIKAEQRSFRTDLGSVRETALLALSKAEAANERIDNLVK